MGTNLSSESWSWRDLLGFGGINQRIVNYSGDEDRSRFGIALRVVQGVILDRLIAAYNSGCVSDEANLGCSALVSASIKRILSKIAAVLSKFTSVSHLPAIQDDNVAELWTSHFSHLVSCIETMSSPIMAPKLAIPPGPPI